MPAPMTPPMPACPQCGSALVRVGRSDLMAPRWECQSRFCGVAVPEHDGSVPSSSLTSGRLTGLRRDYEAVLAGAYTHAEKDMARHVLALLAHKIGRAHV